jgi:argininosuccinate lyase
MMKLWQKENTKTTAAIERFTVGNDREFDLLLAKHDVQGSLAHIQMLSECGLMTKEEEQSASRGLRAIATTIEEGTFRIEEGVEDVHSQVELLLTRQIGEAGKKIHAGRSRNDQVALDIKLFLREEIRELKKEVDEVFHLLLEQSERFSSILLPGYTHLQIAMPSSAGLWLGCYAESLVDDTELLLAAYHVINKNPLGSGAGYGSSFPLNRKRTTELLHFREMNWNAAYAQFARGKSEKILSMAMSSIAHTLSRFSMDCCLYVNQNFGFIQFPPELTTGSSIMPHKKNPDVFELIRAHSNRIQSIPNELTLLTNNLPSGYHRDMQLTKEILFPAIAQLKSCLQLTCLMLKHISFRDNILSEEKYKYLFSVEAVNELVRSGMPFRDAYKKVGEDIEKGMFSFDPEKELHHTHEGSIGNLCNKEIARQMQMLSEAFDH